MEEQFFGEAPQDNSQFPTKHSLTQHSNEEDEFDFNGSNNHVQLSNPIIGSETNSIENDEVVRKIREDQERIQEKLRAQSNQEYNEKQKRKQAGSKQLEEFLSKKESETVLRRQENIQKQKALIEKSKQLTQQTAWGKVAANVPLKQGEHKGNKDITRMRESIINKKNDLSK